MFDKQKRKKDELSKMFFQLNSPNRHYVMAIMRSLKFAQEILNVKGDKAAT